jgi:cholesterol oxidase
MTSPTTPVRPSLTANEDMKGYMTVGDLPTATREDYENAFVEGRRSNTWVLTHLNLRTDDLPALLADPKHPIGITGTIRADSLWGRADISGVLGLFVPTDNPALKRLEYHFTFDTAEEGRLTFAGYKELSDDLLTSVLQDQQVLYFRIVRGEVAWDAVGGAPVYAVGIVNLYLWDFLRRNVLQLRVHGPNRPLWLLRWLRFFLGTNVRFILLKLAGRRK